MEKKKEVNTLKLKESIIFNRLVVIIFFLLLNNFEDSPIFVIASFIKANSILIIRTS
jgi:hypothetical protein